MNEILVIVIALCIVTLVALFIIRPTDVDVAARGLRVRLRRRTEGRDQRSR